MGTLRSPSSLESLFQWNNHLRFERQESISSYIIRFANGNGYYDLRVFLQLMFHTEKPVPRSFYLPLQNDFVPKDGFKGLTVFSGISEDKLLSTTFSHLVDTFLGQHNFPEAYKWLRSYLNDGFAYCPLCVKQYKYYSLTWRFAGNPGCPEHAIKLVGKCHCCHATLPLPLRSRNSKIGYCPLCEADLTLAPTISLDQQSYAKTQEFEDRIMLLLSPHEDRRLHPEQEFTRFRRNTMPSDVMQINWDVDLPEYQDFIKFQSYFQEKWNAQNKGSSKLPEMIRLLFSLYWIGSSVHDGMLSYLKFRDDPFGLIEELNHKFPYLLGMQYFCRGILPMNKNLPSKFDLLPIDAATQQLKDLIFEIKVFANRLQMDLFYEPDRVKDVSEELHNETLKWETRIREIRAKHQGS